jgi:acyl dehydratase
MNDRPEMPPSSDRDLLVSEWMTIDQQRISTFGDCTNDPDPLHVDPTYAANFGPYGHTIAFGFLTMSLLTYLYRQGRPDEPGGYALNYGFDRLRLTNIVPVGARVRGVFRRIGSEDRGRGRRLDRYDVRVEIEGDPKPALVAEWLTMRVDDGVHRPVTGGAPGE